MRSVPVTAYVTKLQKNRLAKRAEKRCLPISGYLSRLIDKDDENSLEEKGNPLRPGEELEQATRRSDTARRGADSFTICDLERSEKNIVGRYDSADELIGSLDEDRENRGVC